MRPGELVYHVRLRQVERTFSCRECSALGNKGRRYVAQFSMHARVARERFVRLSRQSLRCSLKSDVEIRDLSRIPDERGHLMRGDGGEGG